MIWVFLVLFPHFLSLNQTRVCASFQTIFVVALPSITVFFASIIRMNLWNVGWKVHLIHTGFTCTCAFITIMHTSHNNDSILIAFILKLFTASYLINCCSTFLVCNGR
eukprot:48134_1